MPEKGSRIDELIGNDFRDKSDEEIIAILTSTIDFLSGDNFAMAHQYGFDEQFVEMLKDRLRDFKAACEQVRQAAISESIAKAKLNALADQLLGEFPTSSGGH